MPVSLLLYSKVTIVYENIYPCTFQQFLKKQLEFLTVVLERSGDVIYLVNILYCVLQTGVIMKKTIAKNKFIKHCKNDAIISVKDQP